MEAQSKLKYVRISTMEIMLTLAQAFGPKYRHLLHTVCSCNAPNTYRITGLIYTRLPLEEAFKYQDARRFISSRRFVPPSFNDIRLILNTAQIMGLTSAGPLELATFDGDVTL